MIEVQKIVVLLLTKLWYCNVHCRLAVYCRFCLEMKWYIAIRVGDSTDIVILLNVLRSQGILKLVLQYYRILQYGLQTHGILQ